MTAVRNSFTNPVCLGCKKSFDKLSLTCEKCKTLFYCSIECQQRKPHGCGVQDDGKKPISSRKFSVSVTDPNGGKKDL